MRLQMKQVKKFKEYAQNNPHVLEEFDRIAMQLAAKTPRYSARDILPIMRWHTVISGNGSDFKISNDISPYLARLFEEKHPRYQNFFSKKIEWGEFNLTEYIYGYTRVKDKGEIEEALI